MTVLDFYVVSSFMYTKATRVKPQSQLMPYNVHFRVPLASWHVFVVIFSSCSDWSWVKSSLCCVFYVPEIIPACVSKNDDENDKAMTEITALRITPRITFSSNLNTLKEWAFHQQSLSDFLSSKRTFFSLAFQMVVYFRL